MIEQSSVAERARSRRRVDAALDGDREAGVVIDSIWGLETRVSAALTAMYGWFAEHGEELFPIYRDMASMPRLTQDAMRDDTRHLAELMMGEDLPRGEAGRRLRAVARHVLDYRTWRSLAIDQELGSWATVETAVRMLLSAR